MSTHSGPLLDWLPEARSTQDDAETLEDVLDSFRQAVHKRPAQGSSPMADWYELLRFCQLDELAPWLKNSRASLVTTARMAREWGHPQVAAILDDLLAGRLNQSAHRDLSDFNADELKLFGIDPEASIEPDYSNTEEALAELLDALATTVLDRLPAQVWAAQLPLPRRVARARRLASRKTSDHPTVLAQAIERFAAFTEQAAAKIVAVQCHDDADRRNFACTHELLAAHTASTDPMLARVEHPHNRKALTALFARCDGARLFVVDGVAGLVINPPSAWPKLLEQITDCWIEYEDEMAPEELLIIRNAVPLARIQQAATWFLLVESGPSAGKIVMFSHDGLEVSDPIANHLVDFLDRIPKQAIRWIASDVRYRPPGIAEQYYPVGYRP